MCTPIFYPVLIIMRKLEAMFHACHIQKEQATDIISNHGSYQQLLFKLTYKNSIAFFMCPEFSPLYTLFASFPVHKKF